MGTVSAGRGHPGTRGEPDPERADAPDVRDSTRQPEQGLSHGIRAPEGGSGSEKSGTEAAPPGGEKPSSPPCGDSHRPWGEGRGGEGRSGPCGEGVIHSADIGMNAWGSPFTAPS